MIITRLIYLKRRREGRLTTRRRVVTFVLILFVLYVPGGLIYFSFYSNATDNALKYMNSTDTVAVSEIDQGYLFDGPGTRDAIAFYPGAKVDEKAYAPLMQMIADAGIDCFLIKMPLHMAFLGKNKADDVIDEYNYENWYISGHSLGGAMAGIYAASHGDKIRGMILLAAYSTAKIDDSVSALAITATNDHVMDWEDYNENKGNLPLNTTEVSIEGGNHSQFGDYGFQRGDGEATISQDEQMEQVRDAVRKLVNGE